MVYGTILCDEWSFIKYATDLRQKAVCFEKNITITVESYINKVSCKEGIKLKKHYIVSENGLN